MNLASPNTKDDDPLKGNSPYVLVAVTLQITIPETPISKIDEARKLWVDVLNDN